jgi:hypothetical protein
MAAIKAICTLQSISPISFSRHYEDPYLEKEMPDDYEKRTWRERLHYDKDTLECFIPPMMFKHCLTASAEYLGLKIVGKRGATYTKHFKAGILVTDRMMLGIHRDDVEGIPLFVPPNGRPGGSTRVTKWFPDIASWKGTIIYYVLDTIITQDVFREHLEQAGSFIGLGRFRPRVGGYYGRFEVLSIDWQDPNRPAAAPSRGTRRKAEAVEA